MPTPTTRKPRRVRACNCPHCGGLTVVQRRSKEDIADGLHIILCNHCFMQLDATAEPTFLSENEPWKFLPAKRPAVRND